ncbi:MAG: hypothetical protein JWM19_3339, partial [Actinomycetia bacterium]|nr:hypothetical protein [Actinomycetes bacterium]
SLGEQPTPEYAAEIVRGVASHSAEIDQLISRNSLDWTLERMPAVDRNVLRIGVWELLWADDVPDGVAISEAVLLAQDLSTDGSAGFVNGLLGSVQATKSAPGSTGSGDGKRARPLVKPPRAAVRADAADSPDSAQE